MIGAALALFAVAAAGALFIGRAGSLSPLRARSVRWVWLLNFAGAVVCVVAGARAMAGAPVTLVLGGARLGADLGGTLDLSLDRLSGLFTVISFGVAVPAVCAMAIAVSGHRSRLPAVAAMVLASMVIIYTATTDFVFLFGWESLTVAFFLAVGFDRHLRGRTRAAVVTEVFGRSSGAFLLLGMLVVSTMSGSGFEFARWHVSDPVLGAAAYALLLAGFAVKIGLIPVHVWLPDAYTAASPAMRGLLAGAAVNVGFYGMWRTLQLLGPPPTWLACVVVVAGGVSAIYGIAQAAVNPGLPTMIAWSSVENSGIITAGFGVALAGAAVGNGAIETTGLVAATAQIITHALAKTLLFVSTHAAQEITGATELDDLRGLSHRLPWAATGLCLGALGLAGIPLTAGFTSEWLTLEAFMQQFRLPGLALQLCVTVAGVLVALTVGVSAMTFVRMVGLTATGADRTATVSPSALGDTERRAPYRMAVVLLGGGILVVSAVAPLQIRFIGVGLGDIAGSGLDAMHPTSWIIGPAFDEFSSLSPSWLWIVLPSIAAVIAVVTLLLSRGRVVRARRVEAWSSASPGVERGPGYTSFAFANPMRNVLGNLLRTRSTRRFGDLSGRDVDFRVEVSDLIARRVYRPAGRALMTVVGVAKRLQSGRLDAYMAYMLIAVLGVLAIALAVA